MTTNRLPRNAQNPFVVIPTSLVRNTKLRAIEKVVLQTLLSFSDGWQPCVVHLAGLLNEGVYAVQRAINRLKELGYLVCHSIRDKHGRFAEWAWTINEFPNLPSEDNNFDVYGHVVTFDRPQGYTTNLRKSAKNNAQKNQKSKAKSKAETPTTATFCPDLENPDMENRTGSNIDTSIIYKNLEREDFWQKKEEEFAQQAQPLELDTTPIHFGREQTESSRDLLTSKEFATNAKSNNLEKGSGAAEFASVAEVAYPKEESAYPKAEVACINVEVAYPKEEFGYEKEEFANYNQAELLEFQIQLQDLGKRLGKKNPAAWAYTIVKNLKTTPCVYWEDFKAGRVLGASEQHEWEVAPGVPCQVAIQCLEQDYLNKPGTTPIAASAWAARIIDDPSKMRIIWETMKNRVLFQKRKHDEQKAMGIENPNTMESWMKSRPKAKIEDVAIALVEMQSDLPPALQPVHSEQLPLEPVVEESVVEESLSDEDFDWPVPEPKVVEVEQAIVEPEVEVTDRPGIPEQFKQAIAQTLNKFSGRRKNRRQSIREANMEEARKFAEESGAEFSPVEPSSTGGGLASYLATLEFNRVPDNEIW